MPQKILLAIIILFNTQLLKAQQGAAVKATSERHTHPYTRFVGKYDLDGAMIHFVLRQGNLALMVPGAPIQNLRSIARNEFQSLVFKDQRFVFTEHNGEIKVTCKDQHKILDGKKVSNQAEILSDVMDSSLVRKKSTEHFIFLYSTIDSVGIDSIARDMENSYNSILRDFKLKSIPVVTVRIYPDLKSFHNGINYPEASDQVLATAFGKDDIRMVSPNNAGPEGWMLTHFASHEFTHCVHLNIDYSPNNPRWLWEGVAQYEAGWFFDPKELDFMKEKKFPRLSELNNGLEYMLGFVIIESVKDIWGFDVVINLIKNRGNVEKILKLSEVQFEEKVFSHVYKKYIQK